MGVDLPLLSEGDEAAGDVMADADQNSPLGSAVIEAANRAEVTALLIRCGYRVYRSEADIDGEDMVVMAPGGHLRRVQLKGRPYVEWKRYGGRDLWMLFPSAPWRFNAARTWYLVPHDTFFAWVKARHGHTPKWLDAWSYPTTSKDLAAYLAEWTLRSPAEKI